MLLNQNIALRPLRVEDLPIIHEWRNDLLIKKQTQGIRFPITKELDEEWLESVLNDKSNRRIILAIEDTDGQNLIGIIQATGIDWISRTCDFGIQIPNTEYQGKGVGKKAMTSFFDYLFNLLGLRKICLQVVVDNELAIGSYNKLGFEEEGRLKEQFYWDGAYHDVLLMGLFKNKFNGK